MYPLDILIEWMKQLDEVQLCELLDVSAEDLIAAFAHKIKERRAYLEKEMELVIINPDGTLDSGSMETRRELDLSNPAWEEYNTGYYDDDSND